MLRLFVVLVVICRLAGQGNAFKTPMPSVATRMISLYSRSKFIQNIDLSKNCKISDDSLALENIANGQDMFVLPQGLCLDVKKAEAKFRPEGVTADRLRTGNFGMLAILLLAEKYAGEKSKYRYKSKIHIRTSFGYKGKENILGIFNRYGQEIIQPLYNQPMVKYEYGFATYC